MTENPPAFPVPNLRNSVGQELTGSRGMSMRDYFAGQAMAGFTANSEAMSALARKHGDKFPEQLAIRCYVIADAMLAKGTIEP